MNQFAGRSEDMDFSASRSVSLGLTERIKAVKQPLPESRSDQESAARYHIGDHVKLITKTGASVSGKLGGVSQETGDFYVGSRLYSLIRFRESINVFVDPNTNKPYLEVKQ